MFEGRHQKIAPFSVYLKRLAVCTAVAFFLIVFSLLVGMAGYHWLAGLNWMDSFLNASMILSGMGPVNLLTNTGAKIFASIYALFSGIIFMAALGIVFSPIIHRMLHRFHLADKDWQV